MACEIPGTGLRNVQHARFGVALLDGAVSCGGRNPPAAKVLLAVVSLQRVRDPDKMVFIDPSGNTDQGV